MRKVRLIIFDNDARQRARPPKVCIARLSWLLVGANGDPRASDVGGSFNVEQSFGHTGNLKYILSSGFDSERNRLRKIKAAGLITFTVPDGDGDEAAGSGFGEVSGVFKDGSRTQSRFVGVLVGVYVSDILSLRGQAQSNKCHCRCKQERAGLESPWFPDP